MKRLSFILLFVAVVLIPATASAVTIQEIVALSRAGVADEVIIALIDRDKGVFPIEAAQLEELRAAGVSQTVVLAMLKSGPSTPPPASSLVGEGPQLVIVGHGPDVPNTAAAYVDIPFVPFVAPYLVGPVAGRGACAPSGHAVQSASSTISPATPFGRFMNDPMARFTNNGFIPTSGVAVVSDCQPSARRRATPRPRP
jgi:hypothetical protein